MRCYICDKALTEPNWSTDHDCYDPCVECLEIIQDAVGQDKASATEDDLPEPEPDIHPGCNPYADESDEWDGEYL